MSLGPAEILVVLVIALIVFGPKKLPEVGRQIGGAMRELRKMQSTVEQEIRSVIDDHVGPTATMQPNPQPPLADPPVDAVSRPSAIEPTAPAPAAAEPEPPDIDGLSGGSFS